MSAQHVTQVNKWCQYSSGISEQVVSVQYGAQVSGVNTICDMSEQVASTPYDISEQVTYVSKQCKNNNNANDQVRYR